MLKDSISFFFSLRRTQHNYATSLFQKMLLIGMLMYSCSLLSAQNREWGIDKETKRAQKELQEQDSLMVHLKGNWQVSLGFGRRHFNSSTVTAEETLLAFPRNTGIWNLSVAKYLSESVAINVNLGIHLKKVEPPRPTLLSIIGGQEVELDGGGVLFLPLSVGVDYFFMKKRFRPYAGLGLGVVPARFKYIEGSGNINTGFNKDEYNVNSNTPFVELSAGFIYRVGKRFQLGLNGDYLRSTKFKETVGSYEAYDGLTISATCSFLF